MFSPERYISWHWRDKDRKGICGMTQISAAGFTLLEVMASVAILGIGIILILRLFSAGLGLARAGSNYTESVSQARAKLSEVLLDENLEEGTTDGSTGEGFEWTVEVSPFREEMTADAPKLRILKVVVGMKGPDGCNCPVTLTSLKAVFE